MKKFYVLILCFSSSLLIGQNYQNICTPGITLYKNSSGYIKAFEEDSLYFPDVGDTLFISYRTIRPYRINNCYDTTNGSILGRRIYKKNDGTFYFFNYQHDTLTIMAQTALNGIWKFCDLTGGSRIAAQVTSISQDTVLGMADQVKVITFQAKDMNGNNISHFLNQKTIKLSQHYGLSQTFDLYFMPDIETYDASTYLLSGKTVPALGIQNLPWKDIYNFDVGDEFNWSGFWWNDEGPSWEIIEWVLGKQVFGNIDSVKYTMEHCQITYLPQPPPNEEKEYDTIIVSYNFHKMNNGEVQDLPEYFQRGPGTHAPSFTRSMQFHERQTQETTSWRYTGSEHCWMDPFEPTYSVEDYSEGLGNTYQFSQEWQNWPVTWSESMVYYKKGSETWGTPLAPSCSELVTVEETEKPIVPAISVIPNPAKDKCQVQSAKCHIKNIEIYNLMGEKVYGAEFPAGAGDAVEVDLDFPAGIYFVKVTSEKGVMVGKVVKN
jgi:hypothetical protein